MTRRSWLAPVIVWMSLVAGTAAAETLVGEIDRVMARYDELDLFSGTVLVARDGDVLYARAFGEANKDHGVANTLETRYNIGSIGKTFTGTAIMQLVERGTVALDAPVTRYLPEFPYGDAITIHHLLSHTSGLFNYMAHPDYADRKSRLRRIDDFLPLIYDQELRFAEPGADYAYSNSGIVVLGAVIEKVSGLAYEEYLRQNILGPLGMTSTGLNFWDEVVPHRAMGYTKRITGEYTAAVFAVPPASADGGIETTVLDLLRFDRALYGDELLSEASKQKMFTPNLSDYGYTWSIRERAGRRAVSHGGGAPGVNAMFLRYVDDDVTIIALSNYSGGAVAVAGTIEAIVFGQPYDEPRPPLPQALFRALDDGELEVSAEAVGAWLQDRGQQPESSATLNVIGYDFLFAGEVDAAVAIFELNAERFADEANPWDSLGEAYLAAGERDKGIACYRRALEIDPEFPSAIRALERLGATE